MKRRLNLLIQIFVLHCIFVYASGCLPNMCRRKRQAQNNRRPIRLDNVKGCVGQSPMWTRQIAYCLDLEEIPMVIRAKQWYQETYRLCEQRACRVAGSSRQVANIKGCVDCWSEKISNDGIARNVSSKVTTERVKKCVNDYIFAYLDKANEPKLNALSRHKYNVDLPKTRPANYWWSVTVDLPCKPKKFVFFNAYCINSFGLNLKQGEDFMLVQNNLLQNDDGMTFFVDFTKDCVFEGKDIKIVWSESTPTPALPQTGPLNSDFSSPRNTKLNIYFDVDAAARLTRVDGGNVPEFQTVKGNTKGRRKRDTNQRENQRLAKLGLEFPCIIGSLLIPVEDSRGDRSYEILGSTGNRYLINTKAYGRAKKTSNLEFKLNFGSSGCSFGAGDVITVANPPDDWLSEQKIGIVCTTCHNAGSDSECAERGVSTTCMKDEICQTEVRHITSKRRLITKSCKRGGVCRENSVRRQASECDPGRPGSVCVCCCNSNLCNASTNC